MDTEKMYKIGNLILTDKREKNLHLISMKDGKKTKTDRHTNIGVKLAKNILLLQLSLFKIIIMIHQKEIIKN